MLQRLNTRELPDDAWEIIKAVYHSPDTPRLNLARRFSGRRVSALIEGGYLALSHRRELVRLTELAQKEIHETRPFTADEDDLIRRARSENASFRDIARQLKRRPSTVMMRAGELRSAKPESFSEYVPAWRSRRLRLEISDAERRGLDPNDRGSDISHRALRRRFRAAQDLLRAPFFRNTRSWRAADLKALRSLRLEGQSVRAIARVLGRPPVEVAHRLHMEGRALSGSWTTIEDNYIFRQRQARLTHKEIARHLPGRTTASVRQRAKALFPTHGHCWTTDEDERVLLLYAEGIAGAPAMQKIPGRSAKALLRRLQGLLQNGPQDKPLTGPEVILIAAARKRGERSEDIAKWMLRPEEVIQSTLANMDRIGRRGGDYAFSQEEAVHFASEFASGARISALARQHGVKHVTMKRTIERGSLLRKPCE